MIQVVNFHKKNGKELTNLCLDHRYTLGLEGAQPENEAEPVKPSDLREQILGRAVHEKRYLTRCSLSRKNDNIYKTSSFFTQK